MTTFLTLNEFIQQRDDGSLWQQPWLKMFEGLDLTFLTAVAKAKTVAVRRFTTWLWLRVLQKKYGKVNVTLTKQTTPYMTDDGVIYLPEGDLAHPKRFFMALTHESAHLLLSKQDGYQKLKELDLLYTAEDSAMRSPLEYCANALTLAMLCRCHALAPNAPYLAELIDDLRKDLGIIA